MSLLRAQKLFIKNSKNLNELPVLRTQVTNGKVKRQRFKLHESFFKDIRNLFVFRNGILQERSYDYTVRNNVVRLLPKMDRRESITFIAYS